MASYNGGGRDPRGDYASKEADRIKDMTAALKQWDRESINRCRGNQIEAKKKLVEAIGFDRRFDSFDSQRRRSS